MQSGSADASRAAMRQQPFSPPCLAARVAGTYWDACKAIGTFRKIDSVEQKHRPGRLSVKVTAFIAPPRTPSEELAGLVERVTFFNGETGFSVLRVRGQRDLATVIGSLPSVSAGEWLTGPRRAEY